MHAGWIWLMVAAAMAFVWAMDAIIRRAKRHDGEEVSKFVERHGPLCVVCEKAPATHRLPVIARSWFESLNPLRSLYGSVHLYRRSEDNYSAPTVCEAHRDLYASFMDEGLARVRALSSEFSAQMDRQVSDLRTGVLLARTRHYVAGEAAEHVAPVLQLAPAPEPEEMAISAQTTNGKPVTQVTN